MVPAQTGPALPGAVIAGPGPAAALPAGQQAVHEPAAPEPVTPPAAQQPVTGSSRSQSAAVVTVSSRVAPVAAAVVAACQQQPVTQEPVSQHLTTQEPASGSLLDGPLPASAARMPVLAPDAVPGRVQPGSAEPGVVEPVVQAGQQPQVAGESVAGPPVAGQVPQAGGVVPGQQVLGQQETVQPGQDSAEAAGQDPGATAGGPVPQEPARLSGTSGGLPAGPARVRVPDAAGREVAGDGTARGLAGPVRARDGRRARLGGDHARGAGTPWARGGIWRARCAGGCGRAR